LLSERDRPQWAAGTDAEAKFSKKDTQIHTLPSPVHTATHCNTLQDSATTDAEAKFSTQLRLDATNEQAIPGGGGVREAEEEGFPMSSVVKICISDGVSEVAGGGGGGVEGGGEGGRRVKTLGRSVLNLAANTNHTTACGECAEFCSEYK